MMEALRPRVVSAESRCLRIQTEEHFQLIDITDEVADLVHLMRLRDGTVSVF